MGLKRWWRNRFGKDVRVFRDDEIIEAYVLAGAEMGSVVSMIYMGECVGFDRLLDQWQLTEKAYSGLGYRTLSIDDFVSFGGWGKSIDHLVRVPRKEGETEVFHAAYYRQRYHRKMFISEAIGKAFQGEVAMAQYEMPSTDHLKQG